MILSISKFKLYYPNGDSEYGGGGDEGGAKESDPSSDPGTSTPTGTPTGGYGGSTSNTIESSFISRTKPIIKSNDKIINGFSLNVFNIIPEGGKTGTVKIKGTPGAMFSIEIKDSSDCSILEENISKTYKTIPNNGIYEFEQVFPSIFVGVSSSRRTSKTKEIYTATLTPAADVKISSDISNIIYINQYANPTITVTKTTSQSGPALSASGSDVTISGEAMSTGRETKTYTLTLTAAEGEEDSGTWYVKNDKLNFDDRISTSTVIKKKIDRCGGTGEIRTLTLDPLTTRTESSIEGEDKTTGDLQAGMMMYAKVEKTKTVVASLDSENNVLDFETCKNKKTDRIKLSDTNELFEGMAIVLSGRRIGIVKSIVCEKTITTSFERYIPRDTSLKFVREWRTNIHNVVNNNSKGQTQVSVISAVDIPHHTEIEFDDNSSVVTGAITHSGSGTDTVTLTTNINARKFGKKDVTYTLDLDEFITRKPNAYDKIATTAKETGVTIKMAEGDYDSNATSKVGTVVRQPGNGKVGSYAASTDSFTYTPAKGFTGEDSFTYTMRDSANTSEEKTVYITVK
jgi:hypothetical protein